MKGLPGSTRVRRQVVKQALGHLDGLAQEYARDPVLMREVADGYVRLGNVQGNPYFQNLGDIPGALKSYRKALTIRESLWRTHPNRARAIRDVAESYKMTGGMLANTGKAPEGLRLMTQARQLMEKLADSNPTFARVKLFGFYTAESHWLTALGQDEAAHSNLRKAQAIVEAASRKHPTMYRVFEELSQLMAKTGDPQAALAWQQRAHEYLDDHPQRRPKNARAHRRLAKRLAAVGKMTSAIASAQMALRL